MPEAMTAILPLLSGVGAIGNLVSGIQKGKETSALMKEQKLAANPAYVSKLVQGATQPLDTGLVQSVTNAVQGADAERGLATSPGVFSADLAQALAPYELQEQNMALNQVLTELGLPAQYGQTILGGGFGSSNLSPAMLALLMRNNAGGGGGNTAANLAAEGDYAGGGEGDYAGFFSQPNYTDSPIDFSQLAVTG